jgi:ribonuclease P protein component
MRKSKATAPTELALRTAFQSQVKATARVSVLELTATDETDLSTAQSSTQTHTRLSRPDGDARGAQRAETPSCQGSQTPGDNNPAEATGLNSGAQLQPRSSFKATDRLRRRSEFQHVQRQGVRAQTDHFVVYAARFPGTRTVRLGTAISRRLGNAVIRNRIKRRIRECFRVGLRLKFPPGTGVMVIGRMGAEALEMASVMRELDSVVTNLQLSSESVS